LRGASFPHVGIGGDGGVAVTGDVHLVLAHDLAVREVQIGNLALGGFLVVEVEEVELIDVTGGELDGLDVEVIEETTGLVHGGNEGGADHGLAVAVFPAVLLDDGEERVHSVALVVGLVHDLGEGELFGAESLVEGLAEQAVGGRGVDTLEHGEDDEEEVKVGDGG